MEEWTKILLQVSTLFLDMTGSDSLLWCAVCFICVVPVISPGSLNKAKSIYVHFWKERFFKGSLEKNWVLGITKWYFVVSWCLAGQKKVTKGH